MSQLVLGGIKELGQRIDGLETRLPSAPIYGVYWDKGSDPTLIRTHDAVGMEAAVGVDGEWVRNDFDSVEIFGEMGPVTDEYGNVFIRIPKLYIRKTDGPGYKTWAVSKHKHPGFYLPWCFWDHERGRERPYIDYGKHLASLGEGNRLESKPGVHPLVLTSIVNMRTYARNNNVDGVRGYQQLDIHAYDVIRTLMFIEFATLNTQSIMFGFASGRYTNSDTITVSEADTNRAIVANATASNYLVGQSIGIGSEYSNNNVSGTHRVILSIEPYDEENTALVFDGDPITVTEGDVVSNRAYRTGWSERVAASSGSIVSNSDGKYPCMYRGIESPYGDIYQFVDGINVNDWHAWVANNPNHYTSNVFAAPYEPLAYVNSDVNGYVTEMGWDPAHPYAEFPVAVGGGTTTYYSDYYYQNTGQRIAHVGGYWYNGSNAGTSFWPLSDSSPRALVNLGGRLVKKPL